MVTYRILRKGMVKFGARSRPQMDTVETFEAAHEEEPKL